ncbi:MAG: hypothetical protein CME60_02130 [Halobacteriovoraceae bacterium]|nr:hypothetical protein [Halobacteriovoraceae bacterium]
MELIFKDKRFWPLFWTQFAGALNDNFFKNALAILITYQSVQVLGLSPLLLVPLCGGIFVFPFFLFSATAGQMADKYQKAKLIKWIKFIEILIMGLASIGFALNNYFLLLFVLFLMGTQSSFFGPLKYSIIPSLVKREKLVLGNAYVSGGTFVAILIGTILGGSFVDFSHYVLALSLGLLGFAIVGFIFSLSIIDVPIPGSDKVKVDYSFFRPTWSILRLTMRDPVVFRTVLGVSWYWFLGSAILSILPAIVKNLLMGGTEVATLFLAIFTIGMGLGSYFTERISRTKVEIGLVPISALGMSIALLFIFFGLKDLIFIEQSDAYLTISGFYANPLNFFVSFLLLMVAVCGGGYIVPQMSFMQVVAKPSELSQTIAGNNIWNALLMVSAAGLVMASNKLIGIAGTILILAIANLVIAFILYGIYSEETLRLWMRFLSKVFYKVTIKGAEKFPKDGPVVLISNHVSFVDWVLLMGAIDRPIHFVIDYNYYYTPTGPFWFKQAGLVPIATRKESEEVLKKAFDKIYEDLDRGSVMGLFPEGWITRNGEMRKFQPGISKILRNRPVPVVMVAIDGLWGSIFSFKGGKVLLKWPNLKRRKVTLTFSDPVKPDQFCLIESRDWIKGNVSDYDRSN